MKLQLLWHKICTPMLNVSLFCGTSQDGQPQIQMEVQGEECSKEIKDSLNTIQDSLDVILNNTASCSNNCSDTKECPSEASVTVNSTQFTSTTPDESSTSTTTTSTSSATSSTKIPSPTTDMCSCNSTIPTFPPPSKTNFTTGLIFVGPSRFGAEFIYSNLTQASCNVQPTNIGFGYVATKLHYGILFCGGSVLQDHCYLLTNNGAWVSPPISPMMEKRTHASAVSWGNEWLVMGGWDGEKSLNTSEVFYKSNNTWGSSLDMPKPIHGHCTVKINETHFFLAGGRSGGDGGWYGTGSGLTYIYNKNDGFVIQDNMTIQRSYHACCMFQDKIFVAGGLDGISQLDQVTHFSLTSLTWKGLFSHPRLPSVSYSGHLFVLSGSLMYFGYWQHYWEESKRIFKLVRKQYWFEWQEAGRMKTAKEFASLLPLEINWCEDQTS